MVHYVLCPCCHGEGSFKEGLHPKTFDEPCDVCNGKGAVTQKKRMAYVRAFQKQYCGKLELKI